MSARLYHFPSCAVRGELCPYDIHQNDVADHLRLELPALGLDCSLVCHRSASLRAFAQVAAVQFLTFPANQRAGSTFLSPTPNKSPSLRRRTIPPRRLIIFAMAEDNSSELSELSSVPSIDSGLEEAPSPPKKGILKFLTKKKPTATRDESPPPRPRSVSPPREPVLADNPDIAVSRLQFPREKEAG